MQVLFPYYDAGVKKKVCNNYYPQREQLCHISIRKRVFGKDIPNKPVTQVFRTQPLDPWLPKLDDSILPFSCSCCDIYIDGCVKS